MADEAHDWTDKQIEALQRKFGHVYSEAAKEMREKLEKHLEAYEKANAEWQRRVASGAAEQQEYDEWRRKIPTDRKFMSGMVNRLSADATAANQKAIDLINDHIPKVYAENANQAAYQVEKGLGWDTHSFDLYDESTVRRLLTTTDQDQIIHEVIPVGPPRPKWQDLRVDLDRVKDVRWNRQKFTSAITQSILQGESVPNTAKRLMRVLNMDRGMATRAARTAMTSAENAGRIDSYKRAKRIGIDLEQEWMATLDERTRYSHRELDGQHVPVGGKFVAKSTGHELEFPGDPKAHPSETYNCRCTLVAWFPDIEKEDPERWSRLPNGMTYEEWKGIKQGEARSKADGTATRYTVMSNPVWSQLGPVDPKAVADKVDELLSGASGNAASVWAKFEDRIKMVDPVHKKGAFYWGKTGGVHMDVQRSLDDVSKRGALATWFHEFGHNIDYLSSGRPFRALTTIYEEGKFGDTLKAEVEDQIKAKKKEMASRYAELIKAKDLRGMVDEGFLSSGGWTSSVVRRYEQDLERLDDKNYGALNFGPYWNDFSDERKRQYLWDKAVRELDIRPKLGIQQVRDAVGREITNGGKDTQLALGDIFEGATRGKCQDTYGHGKSYWDTGNDALAKEAFAEFYSAECIYAEKPEILDAMVNRLPNSYKVYREITEAMLRD